MENKKIYDCVIIGGGPAGITAGIYLARAGKSVCLVEGGMFGGQVATTSMVENYPAVGKVAGFELANKFYDDLKENDVEIVYENVIDCNSNDIIKEIKTPSQKLYAKTVICAMGVRPRQIDEKIEERFRGKGISYCATCDGNFYKNKRVAVIGGGKSAFSEAEYLSAIAKETTLIHRTDKFRVSDEEVKKLKAKGVKILPFNVLKSVVGEDKLRGIELQNTQTGQVSYFEIEGLFVSVGRVPNSEILAGKIELDENGFIKSDDCTTSASGVFVAGDIRTKDLRQIVTATSDGAISATLAIKYLNTH